MGIDRRELFKSEGSGLQNSLSAFLRIPSAARLPTTNDGDDV
jgi:hypothetical protein